MPNEELILKTLLEIKEDVGGLKSDVRDIGKRADGQDASIKGIAETVGKLWDFQTATKAKVSIIAVIAGGITSALVAFGKVLIERHY